jgi:hypothetical protein
MGQQGIAEKGGFTPPTNFSLAGPGKPSKAVELKAMVVALGFSQARADQLDRSLQDASSVGA